MRERLTATTYISDNKWRKLPKATRAALLKVLPKASIVGRYASNVESALKALGETGLVKRLYG